jgi:RNA polymerase sigma-70 factor (ECF subfamily)
MRTDEELVVQLAHGRQEALGALYGRYADLIWRIAAHRLERAVAEDIVQEVFLTVWRSAGAFDPARGTFRPWLLRLARWRILNELRRRRRVPLLAEEADTVVGRLPDEGPGPEERAWQNEYGQVIQSTLAALPAKQRQAVALAFLEGLTHEQVARVLGVPLGTAKTRIRSGLAQLRVGLERAASPRASVTVMRTSTRSSAGDSPPSRKPARVSASMGALAVPGA